MYLNLALIARNSDTNQIYACRVVTWRGNSCLIGLVAINWSITRRLTFRITGWQANILGRPRHHFGEICAIRDGGFRRWRTRFFYDNVIERYQALEIRRAVNGRDKDMDALLSRRMLFIRFQYSSRKRERRDQEVVRQLVLRQTGLDPVLARLAHFSIRAIAPIARRSI
jgi:hypothetical protein